MKRFVVVLSVVFAVVLTGGAVLGLSAAKAGPLPGLIGAPVARPVSDDVPACLPDKTDDADPDDKPAAKSADSTKSAGTKKGTAKARKPRPQKRVQRFTVEQAAYASDDGVTDLTQRLQTATKDGLLVVFVEKALSDDKKQQKSGSLFLRIQADGEVVEQKIAHRQFYFLDARDPAKLSPKGLVILDAFYGTGIWGENKMVDAKKLLADKISNNQIDIPVKDLIEPIPDPAPGLSKALIVHFAVNGVPLVVMFEEHETVKLSLR